MKYVQITRELFFKLLSYHLLDKFEEKEEIEKGLEAKLNTMVNHEIYSKSKTAPTEEEREKSRQEYLDEYDPVKPGRYMNLDNRISRRRRLTDYVARSTTDIIDNPLWIMTLRIIIRGLSEGSARRSCCLTCNSHSIMKGEI